MKTYNDLLECGEDEKERIPFIMAAVADHKRSELYKTAVDAQLYYNGENPTINKYEKILYDIHGKAHQDMYTANHKIASSFFRIVVKQARSYLLGNGVTFKGEATKGKLGKKFDIMVSRAAEYALIGGVSFGFWNLDHLEVFEVTEFVPLYSEENGALMAGIRFWQIADDKPMRYTLYELDGYTEYSRSGSGPMKILQPKRAYILHVTETELDSTKIYEGENYPTFPIVPLKNNRQCKSELVGKRNTVDALDLACSNMVNGTDEGNIIYWALMNCGGMDLTDAEKFLYMVKKYHIAFMDNADDGAHAEPHTIEAPFDGTQATIDMLQGKLYNDFMALDTSDEAMNSPTATGLRFRYANLDLKTDDFEEQVTEFILGILELAGLDDEPTYTRNQIINKMEDTQVVLLGAEYVPQDYITQKLLTIWGDADMVEDILKQMAADDLGKFVSGADDNPDNETDTPTTDEAIDAAEDAVGKMLNGSQTTSLISVIQQLSEGTLTEGQAARILMTTIGVMWEEALAIIRDEE